MLGIGERNLVSTVKRTGEENRSDSLQTCQKQRLIFYFLFYNKINVAPAAGYLVHPSNLLNKQEDKGFAEDSTPVYL